MLIFYQILCCSDAVGSYAENQRITAVRKVFQRGVINPMINIEQLWRDYGSYENVRLVECCNLYVLGLCFSQIIEYLYMYH